MAETLSLRVSAIMLFTLIVQIFSTDLDLVTKPAAGLQSPIDDMVYKLTGKMVDRALSVHLLHHANLEASTLAKPGSLQVPTASSFPKTPSAKTSPRLTPAFASPSTKSFPIVTKKTLEHLHSRRKTTLKRLHVKTIRNLENLHSRRKETLENLNVGLENLHARRKETLENLHVGWDNLHVRRKQTLEHFRNMRSKFPILEDPYNPAQPYYPDSREVSSSVPVLPKNVELENQAADEDPNFKNFPLWWTSETTEFDEMEVPVQGSLPKWLHGTFFRNGPGRLEFGHRSVTQYFDGFAKVYKFRLEDSKAYYATKFIRTKSYNQSLASNDIRKAMPLFPLDPNPNYLQRMTRLITDHTDNPNVNVWNTGDHVYAMTDSPVTMEIDPISLGTKGYGPQIEGVDTSGEALALSGAHPARVIGGEGTINYLMQIDPKSPKLVLYEDSPDMTRRIIGTVEVPFVTHIHSFAVTKNYAVVFHFPMQMEVANYITGSAVATTDALNWNRDFNTTVYVFDLRKTEAKPQVLHTKAFYALHQINAFETETPRGDVQLNVDLIAYEDGAFMMNNETFGTLPVFRDVHRMKEFYKHLDFKAPTPTRINIDLGSGDAEFKPIKIEDSSGREVHCELPRVNENFRGKESTIFYATCGAEGDPAPGQLGKVNMKTGKVDYIYTPSNYADEAVFVANPDGTAEDDGVILTTVLDGIKKKTYLLVLDGQTLEETARIYAPVHHVAGIHATWIPGSVTPSGAYHVDSPTGGSNIVQKVGKKAPASALLPTRLQRKPRLPKSMQSRQKRKGEGNRKV
jgi:carotenoid cleavage dioxygenase-like enzyme